MLPLNFENEENFGIKMCDRFFFNLLSSYANLKSFSHSRHTDLFKNLITALHGSQLFSGFPLTPQ